MAEVGSDLEALPSEQSWPVNAREGSARPLQSSRTVVAYSSVCFRWKHRLLRGHGGFRRTAIASVRRRVHTFHRGCTAVQKCPIHKLTAVLGCLWFASSCAKRDKLRMEKDDGRNAERPRRRLSQ